MEGGGHPGAWCHKGYDGVCHSWACHRRCHRWSHTAAGGAWHGMLLMHTARASQQQMAALCDLGSSNMGAAALPCHARVEWHVRCTSLCVVPAELLD